MAGIIKGGFGYGYPRSEDSEPPVMKTVYGAQSPAPQPRKKEENEDIPRKIPPEQELPQKEQEQPETVEAEAARLEREKLTAEYEAMRDRYEKESERFVLRAKEKAAEIYEKTKEIAAKTIEDAKAEAEEIKKRADAEGRQQGYDEGLKQGYDDGYVKALKKCKDSLMELKALSEEITAGKEEIFKQNERQLFDTIFEIAQKITVDSLKQKDKAVITKMIREAGKKYRNSKNVRLMLSQLDVSEEAEIDSELLEQVFKNCTNVEIEILKDAPEGTLIIDDGSEITDAGISTQLKMIEQLGRGKYRDKKLTDIIKGKQTENRENNENPPSEEPPAEG